MTQTRLFGMNVVEDEDVPRDEVWLTQEIRPVAEVYPTGFVLKRRFQIVGKIVNLAGSGRKATK